MATLLTLKNKIAGDLHRTDLSSQIADAISSAIDHYEAERWWFTEGRKTMSTANGAAWYGVPDDLKSFDNMLITLSGAKCDLDYVSYDEIDRKDTGQFTGQSSEWTYYANQIRLYPVPDNNYTITLSYHKSLGVPSSDTLSNAWTTEAKELIRHRAVWDVYLNYLKAVDMAKIASVSEQMAYEALTKINTQRLSTGILRRSGFMTTK